MTGVARLRPASKHRPSRPRRHLARLLILLAVGSSLTAFAQTLTVRLVNVKSGKPLGNKNVTFFWGDGPQSTVVLVDAQGIGHVPVPTGIAGFTLVAGPRTGKDPHRLAYADCNANSSTPVKVADVVSHGVTPRDICRNRNAEPHPGEIVFWAEPRSGLFPNGI